MLHHAIFMVLIDMHVFLNLDISSFQPIIVTFVLGLLHAVLRRRKVVLFVYT